MLKTVSFALSALMLSWAAAAADRPDPPPDFSGSWESLNEFALLPPPSGPGPIGDLEGYSHFGFGVDPAHRVINSKPWIGDYKSPTLTPWAAAILKEKAETAIKGEDPFWAASNCLPGGVTSLLWADPSYFVQTKNVVYIIYSRDHDIRRIYMNQPHSKNPKPSWYGESIGHYEAGTLVVDTIGLNDRTFVDRYGTPHSDALHVTERYRILPDGKTLEGLLTFEDPKAYTTQWSAIVKFMRTDEPLDEQACAEAPGNPITGGLFHIPTADTSDF